MIGGTDRVPSRRGASSRWLARLARLDAEREAVVARLDQSDRALAAQITAVRAEHRAQIVAAERELERAWQGIDATIAAYRTAAISRPTAAPTSPWRPSQIPASAADEVLAFLRREGPSPAREIRDGTRTGPAIPAGIWHGFLAVLARDGVLERHGSRERLIYAAPPAVRPA